MFEILTLNSTHLMSVFLSRYINYPLYDTLYTIQCSACILDMRIRVLAM